MFLLSSNYYVQLDSALQNVNTNVNLYNYQNNVLTYCYKRYYQLVFVIDIAN